MMAAMDVKPNKPFGIYLHIPFCERICHYCDFAKTANFSEGFKEAFFANLSKGLDAWLKHFTRNYPEFEPASVFFGGGTPSLFGSEYRDIFAILGSYFNLSNLEVTLEANPEHVTTSSLTTWQVLGFNRISLGVQSFDDAGLRFLTRAHSGDDALTAVKLSKMIFGNVSVDLIYGWPGQSEETWKRDLSLVVQNDLPHVSLYNLTYEPRTALGRKKHRGVIAAVSDETEWQIYQSACKILKGTGYCHDEVANWSKPGRHSVHNRLYWHGHHYIGLGPGAHGFLPGDDFLGIRYSYPSRILAFNAIDFSQVRPGELPGEAVTVDARTADSWLLEFIGTGLRTKEGLDLAKIRGTLGLTFRPHPVIRQGLEQQLLTLRGDTLILSESEWFRETSWSSFLAMSFA
jgi:oxygen-independent coproporphyrinogen-3 oxidase